MFFLINMQNIVLSPPRVFHSSPFPFSPQPCPALAFPSCSQRARRAASLLAPRIMYRRRDTASSRTAYSSADAYRALHSPPSTSAPSLTSQGGQQNTDSSEEDIHPGSPFSPGTPSHPADRPPSFVRSRHAIQRDSQGELVPPRPFFIAEDTTRRSWSASSGHTSVSMDPSEPASDSDGPASSLGMASAGAAAPGPSAGKSESTRSASRVRSQTQPVSPTNPRVLARNRRRRSAVANEYAPGAETTADAESTSPSSSVSHVNPFDTPTNSLYAATPLGVRPPPSAFPFPFQSHPGNPDPGTHIPGMGRRTSLDSIRLKEREQLQRSVGAMGTVYPPGDSAAGYGLVPRSNGSSVDLGRPYAPFMEGNSRDGSATPPSPMASQGHVYRNSAAAAMAGSTTALNSGYGEAAAPGIPRSNSTPALNMRAPFLSPASRPSSSLWLPPSFPYPYPPGQTSSSLSSFPLARKSKPLMPSSRLSQKLSPDDKPWLGKRDWRERASWWITFAMLILGAGAAGVLCFFGWTGVLQLTDADLCPVMNEQFDNLDLQNTWTRDVELGGFQNGEFQMTTDSSDNLFVQDGELYIMPTLTSDTLGRAAILDGGSYSLSGCTSTNKTACSATSSNATGATIQPVMSARISTINSFNITFGKVEVRAKLPRGDWLWPAIWMLPTNNTYGAWPLSGEIDIMEARGNGPAYPAQGVNFVRASLNYGVLQTLQTHLFGWWSQKQSSYDRAFHIYAVEWTPDWMRFYVDSRLQAMMNIKITGHGGKNFFQRGNYPATAAGAGAVEVVVNNIWQEQNGTTAAPFDHAFYLILDLAAGGTSGWFPDNVGGKMWFDGSSSAMRDFAKAQDTWAATWPQDQADGAFRIDYVKMWKLRDGSC
ncbi:Beta-1,3-glucan-binding protein [Grifola frondosa]|uniref:Beta-1,3-glucan-binding protein n=1 Tax=Grifola frondosa TaxID=5627 RepID=A0A1C7MJU3_GRIFR|nr:Beta-1,3-glucan-binding protein [Grifola frondosa]